MKSSCILVGFIWTWFCSSQNCLVHLWWILTMISAHDLEIYLESKYILEILLYLKATLQVIFCNKNVWFLKAHLFQKLSNSGPLYWALNNSLNLRNGGREQIGFIFRIFRYMYIYISDIYIFRYIFSEFSVVSYSMVVYY